MDADGPTQSELYHVPIHRTIRYRYRFLFMAQLSALSLNQLLGNRWAIVAHALAYWLSASFIQGSTLHTPCWRCSVKQKRPPKIPKTQQQILPGNPRAMTTQSRLHKKVLIFCCQANISPFSWQLILDGSSLIAP
jgi:hypothetical protein